MDAPQVWLADGRLVGDEALESGAGWLSASEAARYAAFKRPLRRRQFLLGRTLLRRALGELLDCPPQSIVLEEQPGNAPRLVRDGRALPGFSISHSGPWVACAVSSKSRLGLDIEVLDGRRDLAGLAAQAFGGAEQAWLAARPQASRVRDFYELWCEMEARIKLEPAAGECRRLQHDELAIVLCSEQPILRPVLLRTTESLFPEN
jgi:4'-phosphopantetheinyl transferase